jgi:hypothetical protein
VTLTANEKDKAWVNTPESESPFKLVAGGSAPLAPYW